jgi:hypothetical protein
MNVERISAITVKVSDMGGWRSHYLLLLQGAAQADDTIAMS